MNAFSSFASILYSLWCIWSWNMHSFLNILYLTSHVYVYVQNCRLMDVKFSEFIHVISWILDISEYKNELLTVELYQPAWSVRHQIILPCKFCFVVCMSGSLHSGQLLSSILSCNDLFSSKGETVRNDPVVSTDEITASFLPHMPCTFVFDGSPWFYWVWI